jgi:putative acetyltransferase
MMHTLARFKRRSGKVPIMTIRRASWADGDGLVEIWLRFVRATHAFLSEDDIQSLLPATRDYLTSDGPELWVLCTDNGALMGFMGLSGSDIEALFLAPAFHGRGHGRRLVCHAQELRGDLTVDINEQNDAARRFYAACGFVMEGRSAVDDAGRPFPLLHMRLAALNQAP